MPEFYLPAWIIWALLSAVFAALTAIFAKLGVENIDSDLATFIRTVVILVVLGAFNPLPASPVEPICFLPCRG